MLKESKSIRRALRMSRKCSWAAIFSLCSIFLKLKLDAKESNLHDIAVVALNVISKIRAELMICDRISKDVQIKRMQTWKYHQKTEELNKISSDDADRIWCDSRYKD